MADPITITFNIDSKFRRETSNFKIDVTKKMPAGGREPVLIKYIEKNLAPEDLLGTVVRSGRTIYHEGGSEFTTDVWVVAFVRVLTAEDGYVSYALDSGDESALYSLFYVPSTGALSLIGPYGGHVDK